MFKVIDKNSSFFGMVGEFNRKMNTGCIELWFNAVAGYGATYRGTWLFDANQIEIVAPGEVYVG